MGRFPKLDTKSRCVRFLRDNNMSFEQMIRAFSYYNSLSNEDKDELIDLYQEGYFNGTYY